jgi:hypothetical protein
MAATAAPTRARHQLPADPQSLRALQLFIFDFSQEIGKEQTRPRAHIFEPCGLQQHNQCLQRGPRTHDLEVVPCSGVESNNEMWSSKQQTNQSLVVDEMGYLNLRPEQSNAFFKLVVMTVERLAT